MNKRQEQVASPRATSMGALQSALMASPKALVLLGALALIALIAWAETVTRWEWDLSAFYALPIILVVARTNHRGVGFALAALCTFVWWLTGFANHPSQTPGGIAMALGARMFFLAVVVVATAAVRIQWEQGWERIEMLERVRDLERGLLRASEQEQQRIARELHDGLCQTLAGISALASTLSRKLGTDAAADASAAAAEISSLLTEAIGDARGLARGLGPIGLRQVGLAGALEELASTVRRRFGLSCTVDCECAVPGLGREASAHLFRIVQEAVHNAVTHGRADRIEIRLSGRRGEGIMRVQDNGVGLSEVAPYGDGSGLPSMAHRARLIGGSFEMGRPATGGTVVSCIFPLPTSGEPREASGNSRAQE